MLSNDTREGCFGCLIMTCCIVLGAALVVFAALLSKALL